MTSKPWIRALVVCAASTAACAPAPSDDATDVVTANILLTSPDVRCVQVKAVGATTVTAQADVQPGSTSMLPLAGLAAGSTTFTASAFAVKCASATTATYVSDPIVATVVVGMPLSLSFKMRPAGTTGTGKAVLDFPQSGHVDDFDTGSIYTVSDVVAAPDGNLWFMKDSFGFGVMSPAGIVLKTFNPAGTFSRATLGPDGNIWSIDYNVGKINRILPSGTVRSFPVSGLLPGSMAPGPDGNIWFTDPNNQRVGRITPLGLSTTFVLPTAGGYGYGITGGPDGNLWVPEYNAAKIAKVTPAGVITEYTVPTASSHPYGIAAGPDGNLWFTEVSGNKVVRLTTAGAMTEYPLPMFSLQPQNITRGADGNLWVSCILGAIAKVTTAGAITIYPASTSEAAPSTMATGPDGNIWFAMGSRIGRLTP